jgi:hypothetical protein
MDKIYRLFLIIVAIALIIASCSGQSEEEATTSKAEQPNFAMPKGDFEKSWNTYSSEYDPLGGILTISRKGTKYTKKLVMPDGSSEIKDLTIISEGNEIKLTDRPGNPIGDYMLISSDGYLSFYDNEGFIYSVPPLK